jgi:copper transport protein
MRTASVARLLVIVLSYLVLAAPALAHATMVSSEPVDGAVLPTAPSRLVLTFNEPVVPLILRLVAPDAASTVLQGTTNRAASLMIETPANLRRGTHVLSWRVVSLDGHPVGGTLVFSIGAPSVSPIPTHRVAADPNVSVALWTLKLAFYIGLFIGLGGSFFLAWLAPGPPRICQDAIAAAVLAGLGATPLLIGLQGLDALALPLSSLTNGRAWETGLATSFGVTAIVAAFAFFAGLLALRSRTTAVARALSLFGLVAGGFALALSGHASTASPWWLMRPVVFLHVISVAFWVGALVPIAVAMLRGTSPEAILARFSSTILWAVAALIATGALLAVVQVVKLEALWSTAYGRVLCAKLCLVGILLALATWNRFRLTPAIMDGAIEPRRRLACSIATEVAVALIVLGLVAAWRFTPPPRALALAAAKPMLVHAHGTRAMADMTFNPGRIGLTQVTVSLMSGDFGALHAKEVRLNLENKSAGIEAISRQATEDADGTWRVQDLPIPAGGRWTVTLDILINDFEKVSLEEDVDFRDR